MMTQKHADYARANKKDVLIGGGFKADSEGAFVGGIWVMEVVNRR